jgi:hypothetical protein
VIGAVKFALEIFGWVGLGRWGWSLGHGGFIGGALATGFIVVSAIFWTVFRVPNDHPGKVPIVAIHGPLRLAIELIFFALAAIGFWSTGLRARSETLITGVVLYYGVTWDRQRWLVRQ